MPAPENQEALPKAKTASPLQRLKTALSGALGASAATLCVLLILGWRGATLKSVDQLHAIAQLRDALSGKLPMSEATKLYQPGILSIQALFTKLIPGPAWRAVWLEEVIAAAIVAGLTFKLTQRLSDKRTAALSVVILWGCMPWLAAATTATTTMTLSALLLGLIAAISVPAAARRLWHDLGLALITALLCLSWPAAALIAVLGALLWLKQTAQPAESLRHTPRGALGAPKLPLGLSLALVSGPALATLLYPPLRSLTAWQDLLSSNLLAQPAGDLYRSALTGLERLPWYAGLDLWTWRVSAPLLILSTAGLILLARRRDASNISPQLIALSLVLLLFSPWLSTGALWLYSDLTALAAPLASCCAAIAATSAAVEGIKRVDLKTNPRGRMIALAIAASLAIATISPMLEAALRWPYLGASWATWRGGVAGAIKAGQPAQADGLLPRALVTRAQEQRCALSPSLELMWPQPHAMSAPPVCTLSRINYHDATASPDPAPALDAPGVERYGAQGVTLFAIDKTP